MAPGALSPRDAIVESHNTDTDRDTEGGRGFCGLERASRRVGLPHPKLLTSDPERVLTLDLANI